MLDVQSEPNSVSPDESQAVHNCPSCRQVFELDKNLQIHECSSSQEREIPLQAIAPSPSKSSSSTSLCSSPTSHRNTNKSNSTIDQPVVRLSSGIHEVGMQFGGLRIRNDSFDAPPAEFRAVDILEKPKESPQQPIHALPPVVPQSFQTVSQVQSTPPQTQQPAFVFRQANTPYFYTLAPPASGQENAIGAVDGQIEQQFPVQASHLGGFGGGNCGFDGQRSPGFGDGRNVLSHDNVKGLPAFNQLPSASVSIPHYYPSLQNHQYYGFPYNPVYSTFLPFIKYPTMSHPPPAQRTGEIKQGNVRRDHRDRGLYSSQHQYQHHAPGVGSLAGEYNYLQLYGNQGIQGFMGGRGSNATSRPTLGQRMGGASSESAHKPYSQNFAAYGTPGVGVGTGYSRGGLGGSRITGKVAPMAMAPTGSGRRHVEAVPMDSISNISTSKAV
ncbi:hypothetical protein V8B97DRAFT_1432596 [Scleroderma yunnanense]